MRFMKTILILSLGCITLAEETKINEFDNLAKDIKKYVDQFLPEIHSRMFVTTDDDAMDISYIIANATKDILLKSKKTNDDEYVKNMITEMMTAEIPQEVDFVTKDIDSDSETSYLLQSLENPPSSVDTPKKEIDSDTETSFFLQIAADPMSSSEDTQRKDAPFSVPLYVMGRDRV